MIIYGLLVGVVSYSVNFLLLLGTNRLLRRASNLRGIGIGAGICALHSTLCTASAFAVFDSFIWNIFFLVLAGMIAFGTSIDGIGRCLLYILLSIALSGLTIGTGGGIWMGLCGAVGIFFLCIKLMEHKTDQSNLLPVELSYRDEKVCTWALIDTGNTLKDPISGNPVLIVSPKVASKLVGLSQQQLENPIDAIGDLPGFRLIPYHTVGQNNGLLLGVRLTNIKIGKWQGSSVVAFAPCGLGEKQTYQALTGGNL